MEVMGMTGAAVATRAPLRCGVGAAIGRRSSGGNGRNLTTRSQLFAKKEEQRRRAGRIVVDGLKRLQDAIVVKPGSSSNLFLLSLAVGLAKVESAVALTYDEAVGGGPIDVIDVVDGAAESSSVPAIPDLNLPSIPDLQLDGVTSGLSDFVAENPLAIIGGLVVLALPVIVSNAFKKPQGYGTVSAKDAFAKLGDAGSVTQLLDIRGGEDIRAEGTPDLRSYRKRVTQIPYTADDVEAFVAKVKGKFKEAEETTLYILDRFDGSAPAVAKLLVQNGFKSAYAVKDGAEGPTGWQSSELPWLKPRKGFSFDIGSLKDVFDTDNSSLVPATLGVAAAAGVGLVVFSEAETALQLLGSAALVQIFVKKLLFAKDRKKTFEDLQTFLDTKIAPKELVSELQGIGKVFLPEYKEVKAAAVNGAATVEKTAAPEPALVGASTVSEPKEVESASALVQESPSPEAAPASSVSTESAPASVESATETNSAPTEAAAEVASEQKVEEEQAAEKEPVAATPSKSTDLPRTNRPLSPYTQFPGMKPPPPPSKP